MALMLVNDRQTKPRTQDMLAGLLLVLFLVVVALSQALSAWSAYRGAEAQDQMAKDLARVAHQYEYGR